MHGRDDIIHLHDNCYDTVPPDPSCDQNGGEKKYGHHMVDDFDCCAFLKKLAVDDDATSEEVPAQVDADHT